MKIEKYNPNWNNIYKQEEIKLKEIIKDEIEEIMHVGSTSIEGLMAMPIIDIMICVKQLNNIPKEELLKEYKVIKDVKGELKLTNSEGNIIINIIANNSYLKDNFTMFRDHLLLHPKRMREYNALKEEIMLKDDYKQYGYRKTRFIEKTIDLHKEIYMI